MTRSQRHALEWLPGDGSWKTDAGVLSAALFRFRLAYKHHVEVEPVPGTRKLQYRLTSTGQRLRQVTFQEQTA